MMRDGDPPVFQKPAAAEIDREPSAIEAYAYEARGRLDPAGFERHVDFRTFAPPADLAPFIEHFWVVRWDLPGADYHSDEVMHRPYVDVFVSAEISGIQGTFRGKRTYLAADQGRIVGARFLPGAFHSLWYETLADLQNRILDLQRVFPEADAAFVSKLLAQDDAGAIAALAGLVRARVPKPDPNIALIGEMIAGIEADERLSTVAAVAKKFGRSDRWVQQLFRDYLGIGLKWFLQRHRLLQAAKLIRESDAPDWAAIAYDLGYASQQHFITDFGAVLGKTPVQYKRDVGS